MRKAPLLELNVFVGAELERQEFRMEGVSSS